ncbi:MAG: metal ABC transporter permease [Rhodocyclaceae bacterium]|jgi:zinc transport system permease protein
MNELFGALFDPLFIRPFFTGLCFAALLPLFGAYLRLRDEWLAALAFAQTAAAGSLLAMLAGVPLMLGGLLAAGAAAALKSGFEGAARGVQGAAYALLLVAGWAVSVLLVANLPLAERLGHALFDGQLYFTDASHLVAALASVALFGAGLLRLSNGLLLAHFFPDFFRARGRSVRRIHFVFDLLVAAALALATMSVGVMAAFALVFVPPWVAWSWSMSWHRSLLAGVLVSVGSYVSAFMLALVFDQPFGPVLALILVLVGVVSSVARGFRHPG